ncbi:hypothetical protein EG328_003379 [Venturia inaequalis]|uniref:Uncharacterized protein n=1 Tax=Venturia inaequalis TaxID=5025 RepID=A0A8H3VGD9_VENIN|nr:hypothetical protein EG328_003379 [Venturia inaequalis]
MAGLSASVDSTAASPSTPSPVKPDPSASLAQTSRDASFEQNQIMGSDGMNEHTRAPQPSTPSSLSPSTGGMPMDNRTTQSQSTATPAVSDTAVVPSVTKPPPRVRNGVFPFQDLPPELRNNIYHRALDWNRVQGPMDALKHKIEEMANDTVTQVRLRKEAWITEHEALFQSRQTPTILLLCKHVTSEALSILHDVPLAIDFKPRTRHSRDGLIFYMTENPEEARMENKMPVFKWAMMSLPTVKQVKKATFYIPNWTDGVFRVEILQPWFYLQAMCGVFKQENSRLEELRIEFSGTGGSGVGDMVWILDGRKKELLKILWKKQLHTNIHERIVGFLDRMALKGYLTAVHRPIQRQRSQ